MADAAHVFFIARFAGFVLRCGLCAAERERQGNALAQLFAQGFEPLAGFQVACFVGGRVGIHDEVDFAAEVVHHGQLFRKHEQNIGRADWVGFRRLFQAVGELLEMVDGFIAEIAHQTADEARQAGDFGHFIAGVELLDEGQRVAFVLLDDLAFVVHLHPPAAGFQIGAARQADKGVAAKTFAAHHGFEQVTEGAIGELEVDGKRGVQIGQQLLHQRDAVVAGGSLFAELLQGNHGVGLKRLGLELPEKL